MPHFFPSLRRSKDHSRDNHYARYEEEPHYDSRQSQPSAWRRVVPSRDDGNWQEEFVEYPESYAGGDNYYEARPRSSQPIGRDYARRRGYDTQSESTATATDEVLGESRYYSRDNAVPIVQRESSLTRLQEVFSQQASTSGPRPVTEVTLPQGTPRQTPVDIHPPSRPPPTAELRNVYAAQQQPILVQNSTADSVEADIRIQRSQSYAPRDGRASSRHRADVRQPNPSTRSYEEEEYPPCVVVVERGRHGKPDNYYVIPGGAPVIFEDQHGNELTRVGDFSGRYRPRKQKPVIIEDEHGQEIGRLGFDDESSLDHPYHRAEENLSFGRGREYNTQYPSRSRYDYEKDSSRSSPTSSSFYHPSQERDPYRPADVDRRGTMKQKPNVVYIPFSGSGQRPQRESSRHSGKSARSNYYAPAPSGRSYESSSVIHLDDYRRDGSGSISSGSSGKRSYGSSHRY